MRQIFFAIVIAVSLLMLDARLVVCQESTAAQQSTAQSSSGQQSQQSSSTGAPQKTNVQMTVQLDDKARKIKRMVEKVGIAGKATLFLKNGDDLHGNIVSIDEESFQITEVDLKQVITLHYKNVKKVRKGYGNLNLLTGKRTSPPQGVNIAIAAGVLFMVIGLPIIALRGTR